MGDLIWADWSSSAFSGISHVGIESAVSNGIPLIAQHTTNRKFESIIRWFHYGSNTHVWLAIPNPG